MKNQYKRLRIRLTAISAVLTGSVVILICIFSFLIARDQFQKSKEAEFETTLAQIQNQWDNNDQLDFSWLQALENESHSLIYLEDSGSPLAFSSVSEQKVDLSRDVKELAKSQFGLDTAIPPISGYSDTAAQFPMEDNGREYRCAVILLPGSSGWKTIVVMQDTASEANYLFRLALMFLGIALLGLGIMSILCWVLAGRTLKPVEQAAKRQQEFIASAGHELKTPLAVINTGFSAVRTRPDKTAQYLSYMEDSTAQMARLIDDLLLLAGGETAKWNLDKKPVVPSAVIQELIDAFEVMATELGITIVELEPKVESPCVDADSIRLKQVLGILIDNAMRYAPVGTAIEIQAVVKNKQVHFSIIDHGCGVPDDEKTHVFDKFYRCAQNNHDVHHYGLGLSVAQELAQLHNGSIQVMDTPGGGATFIVVLPLSISSTLQ